MRYAIAFVRQKRLPEWAVGGVLRTALVAFCALAMALAGHLPAL